MGKWKPALLFCMMWMAKLVSAQKLIPQDYIAYDVDTSNSIILRLQADTAGKIICRYDLPQARILNATALNTKRTGDTLNIYLKQPSATFVTTVDLQGILQSATWKQNGQSVSYSIKPMLRPQTPRPPFPYQLDSIEYDNAGKTVQLGATLTYPKGKGKFAAAILITGSGLEDRDEAIFGHRSFAVIADYLTRQGMAVLRVDDRQRGKSKGNVLKATSADFAKDVLTSMAWLKAQPFIDSTRIGLIGHSEGGMLAAMAYGQWPYFAYIISLGGTGVPGWQVMLPQSTNTLKGKISPAAFEALYQLAKQGYATIDRYYENDSLAIATTATEFDSWKKAQPDTVLKELGLKVAIGSQYALQTKMSLANSWMKYFLHFDPAPYWQKVKCPVLALNGGKDTQVDAGQNITAIKKALETGGNHKVAVQIMPNLNHLFQHCHTGEFAEYALIEETFSPEALGKMSQWLRSEKIIK